MEKLTIFICFLLLELAFGMSLQFKPSTNLTLDDEDKIVGGDQIPLALAPYMASLQKLGSHRCGGSIVSTTFILTAAHCTHGQRVRELSVRVGTDQIGVGGNVISIKTIRNHPNYNPATANNDFALLQLASQITLKAGKKEIIALPPANDPIADGTPALVSGWGDTLNSGESSEFLRAVTVPTVSQNYCMLVYPGLTNMMFCAGKVRAGGADSCQVSGLWIYSFMVKLHCSIQGDSGGPLKRISDGVQIGVVSFGNGCGLRFYPGVYARIAAVRSWIKIVAKV